MSDEHKMKKSEEIPKKRNPISNNSMVDMLLSTNQQKILDSETMILKLRKEYGGH